MRGSLIVIEIKEGLGFIGFLRVLILEDLRDWDGAISAKNVLLA